MWARRSLKAPCPEGSPLPDHICGQARRCAVKVNSRGPHSLQRLRDGPSCLSRLRWPRLPLAHSHTVPSQLPSSRDRLSSVPVSVPGVKAHLTPEDLPFSWVHLQRPCFQIQSHPEVPGAHRFGGTILNPAHVGRCERWEPRQGRAGAGCEAGMRGVRRHGQRHCSAGRGLK